MSSFIVSKNDSTSSPSPVGITHPVDENTVRQAMQKFFLQDNLNDPSSPGDDDDIRSGQSFKNTHAKFTSISLTSFLRWMKMIVLSLGELLLEWITLNSDSRNSNTQALIEQVKSCLQPTSNSNTNEDHLRQVRWNCWWEERMRDF